MTGEVQMVQEEEKSPKDSDPLIRRQAVTEAPSSSEGSDEIKDEEADAGSPSCCRICLENDSVPGGFFSRPICTYMFNRSLTSI